MKRSQSILRSFVLAILLLAGASVARSQETNTEPADPYTAAVNSYLHAANGEIKAYEQQIANGEKTGDRTRFATAREALQRCKDLLQRLSTAGQNEFDPLKAQFERARLELQKSLASAQQA